MVKRWLISVLLGLSLLVPLSIARAQEGGDEDAEEWMRLCRRAVASNLYVQRCRNVASEGDWEHFCRRVWGTELWTRRCADQRPDEDLAHYCRRVYGTDAWTRRCAQPTPTFDPIEYCRRIYGTDEWTRRCLNLVPTSTPGPRGEVTAVPATEIAPQRTPEPTAPSRGRP